MRTTYTSMLGIGAFALVSTLIACGGDAAARTAEIENRLVAPAPPTTAHTKKSMLLPTGIDMHFVERGPATGETILFLHGYTDTSRSWLRVLDKLEQIRPDLRMIAVDLRGHGASTLPESPECVGNPGECFSMDDFAADVLAFMDAMGIPRAHIVGHSLGTFIAQEIALTQPERVETMTLVATTATVRGNPVFESFMRDGLVGSFREKLEARGVEWPRDAYTLTPLDVDSTLHDWLATNWVTELSADPEYLARIASETSATRLGTWIGVVQAVEHVDNSKRLESLTVPTLVLWPVQDAFFQQADQNNVIAALDVAATSCSASWIWKQYGKTPLPASGMQESDLGHNLQWGAYDAVADDIAAFVQDRNVPATWTWSDPANPRTLRTGPATAASIRMSQPCAG